MDIFKFPTAADISYSEVASGDLFVLRDISRNENEGGLRGINVTELRKAILGVASNQVGEAQTSHAFTHTDWTVDYAEVEDALDALATIVRDITTALELAGILQSN